MLAGDRAVGDDLAQDTMLRAWRARDGFTPGTDMEAWLFRILRNAHISALRQRTRRGAHLDFDEAGRGLASPDDSGATVSLDDFRRALLQLPPEAREALLLVGVCDWSYEAAAHHVGCPVGTLKSRVFRARRTLMQRLEEGRVGRDGLRASEASGALMAMISAAEAGPGARRPG